MKACLRLLIVLQSATCMGQFYQPTNTEITQAVIDTRAEWIYQWEVIGVAFKRHHTNATYNEVLDHLFAHKPPQGRVIMGDGFEYIDGGYNPQTRDQDNINGIDDSSHPGRLRVIKEWFVDPDDDFNLDTYQIEYIIDGYVKADYEKPIISGIQVDYWELKAGRSPWAKKVPPTPPMFMQLEYLVANANPAEAAWDAEWTIMQTQMLAMGQDLAFAIIEQENSGIGGGGGGPSGGGPPIP